MGGGEAGAGAGAIAEAWKPGPGGEEAWQNGSCWTGTRTNGISPRNANGLGGVMSSHLSRMRHWGHATFSRHPPRAETQTAEGCVSQLAQVARFRRT